jgi:hypothetical protein
MFELRSILQVHQRVGAANRDLISALEGENGGRWALCLPILILSDPYQAANHPIVGIRLQKLSD